MFHQLLTPIDDSLALSFCIATLPILALVILLGILRRPAWQAALTALVVAFAIAVGPWQMPLGPAVQSMLNGATFALWPVMWLVFNGLLVYNIAVRSGRFDAFRHWMTSNLPNDRRIVLVVIGYCFGCLLEGIAGFGCPVAITSSLLILIGFPAMEALVFVLIFNTAPSAVNCRSWR
jgi:lactate permease